MERYRMFTYLEIYEQTHSIFLFDILFGVISGATQASILPITPCDLVGGLCPSLLWEGLSSPN